MRRCMIGVVNSGPALSLIQVNVNVHRYHIEEAHLCGKLENDRKS